MGHGVSVFDEEEVEVTVDLMDTDRDQPLAEVFRKARNQENEGRCIAVLKPPVRSRRMYDCWVNRVRSLVDNVVEG